MRGFYIGIMILLAVLPAEAQSDVQLSQHMFNRMVYNPAVTGASRYVNVTGNLRDQWHGWEGAPRSSVLNVHNFFESIHSGFGITFIHNQIGLEKNLNIKLLYAYHVKLSESSYLSLGMGGGILHRYFDRDKIYSEDMTDSELLSDLEKKSYFDFDFGIEFNTTRFTAGVSVTHLTNGKGKEGISSIGRHYYVFARYQIPVAATWRIEPSFWVQNRRKFSHMELNTITYYRDKVWFGLTCRVDAKFKGESVVPLAGCKITDFLSLGYSYDIHTGALKKYANGAHEILLHIRLPKNSRRYYKSPRFFE